MTAICYDQPKLQQYKLTMKKDQYYRTLYPCGIVPPTTVQRINKLNAHLNGSEKFRCYLDICRILDVIFMKRAILIARWPYEACKYSHSTVNTQVLSIYF